MTTIQFDDGLTANISQRQWACDNSVIARLLQAMSAIERIRPEDGENPDHILALRMCRIFDADIIQDRANPPRATRRSQLTVSLR